jgi:hypothetical protein
MSWFFAALAALLVGVFGPRSPSVALAMQPVLAATFTYDSPNPSDPGFNGRFERAPPAASS